MAYAGKWKYHKQENMEKFLLGLGMPAEKAKDMATVDSLVECGKAGDSLFISATVRGETTKQTFKYGEPFKLNVPFLGINEVVTATEEDNKLIIKGTVTETREIQGDMMIITLVKPGIDVVGKRYLKRA
ncbi:fatty acid-binding protein 1, liver-like [Glandiceps talaboti]